MKTSSEQKWTDCSFVAFDLETSGAYPIGFDVVEFGAVKWKGGQVVDRYQTLLKPREPMSDFIIGIHGITNEMVASAPSMEQKISEIRDFFEGSVLMAHHAPFDMGFMTVDFEKYKVGFPNGKVLCTSLLARALFPESANHKLQTLIGFFGLDKGMAHRAADDAWACLQVGIKCMERMGDVPLEEVFRKQGKELLWKNFSMKDPAVPDLAVLVEAIESKKDLEFVYLSGSQKGETRRASPIGIVRNPDGDYLMAKCHRDGAQKRFYLNKIKDLQMSLLGPG